MRPFRSFLILLILLTCFAGLYYVIPFSSPLPQLEDLIPSSAISRGPSADHTKHPYADSVPPARKDSAALTSNLQMPAGIQSSGKIIPLFDSLMSAGEQIRVMYYGDSQIEGDRISSHLRRSLQARYGGSGPGLFLPLMPVMYTMSLNLRSSQNWGRYNYLSYNDSILDSRALGPFMTICRYFPPGKEAEYETSAFVRIIPSVFSDSAASDYRNLRILYGNVRNKITVRIIAGGRELTADTLSRGVGIHEFRCGLNSPREIRIEFAGKGSPDIYGISIESSDGIVVDNIPQRGSAGLEFTMVDRQNLQEAFRILDPDMIILHYGLNIVRNLRDDYGFYEEGLYRQLILLREVCNDIPIAVVSLSDMAYSKGDSIISFPNIGSIRDAQMKAAERAGAVFWDLREAMGGEQSVVKWAGMNPPLAGDDYVHFTNRGADTIAGMLMRGLFSSSDTVSLAGPADSSSISGIAALIPSVSDSAQQTIDRPVIMKIISSALSYDPDNSFIFTTAGFWIFLLLVLAGYSLVYRKIPLRNGYLFLVSLYFYFKTGGLFLFLLIIVTLVDFFCALLIHKSATRLGKRLSLFLSIASNLGLLAYFKYAAFLTESVNSLFGTEIKVYDLLAALSNSALGTSFDASFIILPVGISFFTFQSLSYTIDVYRKKMEPVRNIIDFGFYVSFFPQLVAGPIVRASVFMPQVYQEFSLTRNEFSHALFMITKGLIKKIIISNFIAVGFVDRVFDNPALYSGFENLMAVYGYGLQIYCDFSGYTDIAIGVALVLGFRLPVNFNSPYKARSITDFWKRWHISLSKWLKDYLYIPLGGNRKGTLRTYFNLMLTMLLGGLWHGASLRFIIWGGLHGLGLVVDRITNSFTVRVKGMRWLIRITGIFLTFNFVNACWILFRAESVDNAFIMLGQMVNNFSPGSWAAVLPAYSEVFVLIITGYVIHFLSEDIKESYRALFIKLPLAIQFAAILIISLALFQLRTTGIMPFIYFRF